MHTANTPVVLQYGVYASETEPLCVVKVVKEGSLEVRMYDLLRGNSNDPVNHSLPCEIIRYDPPLLIMPTGEDPYLLKATRTCDTFYQILEASGTSILLSYVAPCSCDGYGRLSSTYTIIT